MCFDTVKIYVYHSLMSKNFKSNSYHHGDLRQALIEKATEQVDQEGIASLSMRKLGERVGVSRTALYHHFANKNELLSAVAESGFLQWQQQTDQVLQQNVEHDQNLLQGYVESYLNFAIENPAKYELMFGRDLWGEKASSDSLHQVAYKSFDYHVNLIAKWQNQGLLTTDVKALRLAQVTWGALHGISKLFIDGVYVDRKNLTELSETLVLSLLSGRCNNS